MRLEPQAQKNTLQQVSRTQDHAEIITRYQQMYQGIPVIGAQIMIENAQVNGHLLDEIQVNTRPALNPRQAIDIAKQSWFSFNLHKPTYEEQSELQIRAVQNNELKLVYQVSFKTTQNDNKPAWPFLLWMLKVVRSQSNGII